MATADNITKLPAREDGANDRRLELLWTAFKACWDAYVPDMEGDNTLDEAATIEDKMIAIPADSVRGIWPKTQVLDCRLGGILGGESHSVGAQDVLRSIAADVKRLAGAA